MNVHIDPTYANENASLPELRQIRVEDDGLEVDLRSAALSAWTANLDIVIGFLEQAASLSSGRGKIAENEIAFITAFMRDQALRDVTESALLMQVAVIHRQFLSRRRSNLKRRSFRIRPTSFVAH